MFFSTVTLEDRCLLEAAFMRCLIISSDCQNGPKEIIKDRNAGLIFNK